MKCPKCKSTHTEEHGTQPGDFHWWLCRECGNNWPTKEEEHGNELGVHQGRDRRRD